MFLKLVALFDFYCLKLRKWKKCVNKSKSEHVVRDMISVYTHVCLSDWGLFLCIRLTTKSTCWIIEGMSRFVYRAADFERETRNKNVVHEHMSRNPKNRFLIENQFSVLDSTHTRASGFVSFGYQIAIYIRWAKIFGISLLHCGLARILTLKTCL